MKKSASLILCILSALLLFCACSKDEALGLVLSLDCGEGEKWLLEEEKQGVVDLVGEATMDESTGEYVFVFEAVGEGETQLNFYLVQADSQDKSECTKIRRYKVSVDSQFVITSEFLDEESVTKAAVKLSDRKEAEAYFAENIKDTYSDGEEYIIKYIDEYTENGLKWYKFSLSHVVKLDSGESVLRFLRMYAVSENGEIRQLDGEYDIPDEVLGMK